MQNRVARSQSEAEWPYMSSHGDHITRKQEIPPAEALCVASASNQARHHEHTETEDLLLRHGCRLGSEEDRFGFQANE